MKMVISLQGESAQIAWNDGKIECAGYDIDSQRIALALAGGGEGIGVLLIALQDMAKTKDEFQSLLTGFSVSYRSFIRNENKVGNDRFKHFSGDLLYEYLSYSSQSHHRTLAAMHSALHEKLIKRLLNDRDIHVVCALAQRTDLPQSDLMQLANHSHKWVRISLLYNHAIPQEVCEILANDSFSKIRELVARNSKCSPKTLEILASDDSPMVLSLLLEKENLPPNVEEKLLANKSLVRSVELAILTTNFRNRVVALLEKSKDEEILKTLHSSTSYRHDYSPKEAEL